MTTTVVDEIIRVIEYLGQKFGIAIDWGSENLVPIAEHLVRRIVNWCVASSLFWTILCGVMFIGGIIAIIYGLKLSIYGNDFGFALLFIGVLVSVGFGIGLCVSIYDVIKCFAFPELKILEYIQSFMQ